MRSLELDDRGVIKLSGGDARSFLQGLVTNDMTTLEDGGVLYAAMLTPQGKYLYDFLIYQLGDVFYLDAQKSEITALIQRLSMYKLRADVMLEDTSDSIHVYAVFDGCAESALICISDPRHATMGCRALSESKIDGDVLTRSDYEKLRIARGIPDGTRDMQQNKTFCLEANLDHFNGVSFTKGCYVGQEMTARMMHRTTRKKLLVFCTVADGAPEAGTEIIADDEKVAGDIRSSEGALAIAFLKLEYMNSNLTADGRTVVCYE